MNFDELCLKGATLIVLVYLGIVVYRMLDIL